VTLGNRDALSQAGGVGCRFQAFQPTIHVNLAGALSSQAGSLFYLLTKGRVNHCFDV
jgi:hypothetical protein